jgi:transcriptional regulator with XRE-family HTH domain
MSTIKEWRIKRAISQRELARRSGIALSSICHYETDKHKPTFANRHKIAKALSVPVEEIDF